MCKRDQNEHTCMEYLSLSHQIHSLSMERTWSCLSYKMYTWEWVSGSLQFIEDVEPVSEGSDNTWSRSGGGVGKGIRPNLGNLDAARLTVRLRIFEEPFEKREWGSVLRNRSMGLGNIDRCFCAFGDSRAAWRTLRGGAIGWPLSSCCSIFSINSRWGASSEYVECCSGGMGWCF